MVERINKIIKFIQNNKLLSLIIFLMVFMMIIVAFSNRSSQSIDNRDPVIVQMEDEYKVLASTDDLKFYIEYGKYYVLVNNINMTNEQLIRNTLGISSDIEFEIIIPGALLREKGTDMINYYD